MTIEEQLKQAIRDIPDFPKEGIIFKDITPIMMDSKLSNDVLNHMTDSYKNQNIDLSW